MPKTRVVHCRKESYDVYIGRPSKWGNPFGHKPGRNVQFVETRLEAIQSYREWLSQQPHLLEAIKIELKGRVLGCWCKPLACHGDVLAEIADA